MGLEDSKIRRGLLLRTSRSLAIAAVVVVALLMTSALCVEPASAAPRPHLVATAKQTGRSTVRTTVTIAEKAVHKGRTKKVAVTLNPRGSAAVGGRTVTKKVVLRWEKSAYRATVKFSTKRTGKITVKGAGIPKTTKTVKLPASKATSKVKRKTTVNVKVGGSYTTSVTISPGYGRKVRVQRKNADTWSTISTLTAPGKTATLKVTLTSSQLGTGSRTWRIYAPKTLQASAVIATTFMTKRTGTSTTAPPTGSGPVRNCSAGAHWFGADGDWWDETLPDCENLPTISNVYDTWTVNKKCGLTEVCFRAPTGHEQELGLVGNITSTVGDVTYADKNLRYYPADSTLTAGLGTAIETSTSTETLYLPNLVDAMNRFVRARAANYANTHPSWAGLQSESPFRPMWTASFSGPSSMTPQLTFPSGIVGTLTVPGQGGFAQHWARKSTLGHTYTGYWLVDDDTAHSCGQRTAQTCTKTTDNNVGMATDALYPAPAGYSWSCAEQIWNSGVDGTADSILADIDYDHYVRLMNGASASSPVYVNFGAIRWPGSGATVVVEMCRPYMFGTGYTTLPGDTTP